MKLKRVRHRNLKKKIKLNFKQKIRFPIIAKKKIDQDLIVQNKAASHGAQNIWMNENYLRKFQKEKEDKLLLAILIKFN